MKLLLVLSCTVLLVVGSLIGLVFLSVAISTSDAAVSADLFLEALNREDPEHAYTMASTHFRQKQTESRFHLEVAALGPAKFQLNPWWRQTLPQGKSVVLEGTSGADSPKGTPFVIEMVDEDGWKVLRMTDRTNIDVGPGAWFSRIPLETEVARLVKEILMTLNEAVLTGDLSQFVEKIQSQGALENRQSSIVRSFEVLVNERTSFGEIADMEAIFDEPPDWYTITECAPFGGGCRKYGVGTNLEVIGHYPLQPFPLRFRLFYSYQHPDWVLRCDDVLPKCTVTVGPPEPSTSP